MTTDEDLDITARLILMEQRDYKVRSLARFVQEMRKHFPSADTLELIPFWKKYMGMDGRVAPTHDLDTGKRLSQTRL